MNNVTLIGRLTADPELTYTQQNQTAVAKFTLAVDRPRRNREDAGADFIRITVFGKMAETCDRYLSKGRQAGVQGRINTGSYKDRDGRTVYTTDVIADRVEFLGSGNQDGVEWSKNRHNAPTVANSELQELRDAKQYEFPRPIEPVATPVSFDDMPDMFEAATDEIPF